MATQNHLKLSDQEKSLDPTGHAGYTEDAVNDDCYRQHHLIGVTFDCVQHRHLIIYRSRMASIENVKQHS